ncbi:MAG: DUF4870 domain-containing protein, partial [Actinobacteria bacterium]|nr:DUF4870 domain-containing protein [Actinomycetota bacterium]
LLLPWAVGAVFAVWSGIRVWRGGTPNYPWSIPFIGSGVAAKRKELLAVIGGDDDSDQPTPLAALALWFGIIGGPLGICSGTSRERASVAPARPAGEPPRRVSGSDTPRWVSARSSPSASCCRWPPWGRWVTEDRPRDTP